MVKIVDICNTKALFGWKKIERKERKGFKPLVWIVKREERDLKGLSGHLVKISP